MNEVKENIVYEIRNQQVILDRDLAHLLQIETKVLNQKVKRNIEIFQEESYFQLTNEEFLNWKSQIVTSNGDKMGLRRPPFVFTEIGVKKLSEIFHHDLLALFDKNKIVLNKQSDIEEMIYEIRGKQVMLDSDLARLYECENGTKTINQAIRRHSERFPNDFYFQLSKEEYENLKSQVGTSSWNNYGGIRKLPYVFTEEGVSMLSVVLRTKVAADVSIRIMRAFVAMRRYIGNNLIEQNYINELVIKDNKRIDLIEESLSKIEEKRKVNEIYFEGQVYSAYSKLLDIMTEAKKELIIIDGYADKVTLDMISRLKVNVVLIVKEKKMLKELDIEKYNQEFHNLKVIYSDSYHDRYLILDRKKIYHLGASINYAGSRTFSINVLEDEIVKKSLIGEIEKLIK